VKNWDFNAPAGKIELAHKTLRTLLAATDRQWQDDARRHFQETYLDAIEPNVKKMLDAISQLTEVLGSAERQCRSEDE
jgi:hypothetical protein